MRTALYARYSSDQQNPRSIDDQLALMARHAADRGWTVVATFSDAAISGSSMANRPGLLALMAAAEAGGFERVLVEHEDRLSRSLAQLAHMAERLKWARVALSTLASDQVSTIMVAFNGAMAEEYLTNLSQKTRRGMASNAEAGLATGSRLYGYASAPGGALAIVEAEANAVRRIFDLYVSGLTGRDIAARLNREGLAGPRGGAWRAGQITGSRQRGNGILHTELYVGVKVWNRLEVRKDPRTGRRTPTVRPADQWKRTPVPALRIVDQAVWDRAHARLEAVASRAPGTPVRRGGGVFSGLYKCGRCGGSYTSYTGGRLICARRREQGEDACSNRRTVSRRAMDARVLDGLRARLLRPEAVRAYIRAYHEAWAEEQAARRTATAPLTARLAQLDRTITRLVDAVAEGTDSPALRQRLKQAEADRAEAADQLARATAGDGHAAVAPAQAITFHPRLAEIYAARIADLQNRLEALTPAGEETPGPADIELMTSIRDLVERVTITPESDAAGAPVRLTLHGRLALFLNPPAGQKAPRRRLSASDYMGSMVAGARYHRAPISPGPVIRLAI